MTKSEAKLLVKNELEISHKLAEARVANDEESIAIYEAILRQPVYDEAHRKLAK